MSLAPSSTSAHCRDCNCSHFLPLKPALAAAEKLIALLSQEKRIDFAREAASPRPELETGYLYGEARGKMFGVLVCRTPQGEKQVLKAFSGQYNGIWQIDGWVPPLFDVEKFYSLTTPVEKEIKTLGREAADKTRSPDKRRTLLQKRKELSQELMKKIHSLYRLHNFRGEQRSLVDLFHNGNGIPTGTGDCCAPKLLNFAATQGLQPLGLAEFYWGRTNRSSSRQERFFYPACEDKCGPILGFLLCGLEEKRCKS